MIKTYIRYEYVQYEVLVIWMNGKEECRYTCMKRFDAEEKAKDLAEQYGGRYFGMKPRMEKCKDGWYREVQK
jgi:hypothetical protein